MQPKLKVNTKIHNNNKNNNSNDINCSNDNNYFMKPISLSTPNTSPPSPLTPSYGEYRNFNYANSLSSTFCLTPATCPSSKFLSSSMDNLFHESTLTSPLINSISLLGLDSPSPQTPFDVLTCNSNSMPGETVSTPYPSESSILFLENMFLFSSFSHGDQNDSFIHDQPSSKKGVIPVSPTHNTPKYICECGKTFSKLNNMKSHARLHQKDKPHNCTICDRKFVRKHDLKRHQNTHVENYKPFDCHNCGTQFTRLDAMHRHLKANRCRF